MENAGHAKVEGWNLPVMKEENMEVVEKLWLELEKAGAHLDVECTADEVELETTWSQEAMGSMLIGTLSLSGYAGHQRYGGLPPCAADHRQLEGNEGRDRPRKRKLVRRQNTCSRFVNPRGQCAARSCQT